MMRQICKQILTIGRCRQVFFAGIAGLCLTFPAIAPAATLSNAIVIDPLSGVAIGGYDVVSYFTESEPLVGRPEFEYVWRGVPWYFANAANRDVFAGTPTIYAPQFGGYGLMGLARGYLSEGNPRVYEILGGRLFLFYSSSNKDAFMLSQKASYERALESWSVLSYDLSEGQ